MVKLFYITYISVDLAHREIFRAKVGKGGINVINDEHMRFYILLYKLAAKGSDKSVEMCSLVRASTDSTHSLENYM